MFPSIEKFHQCFTFWIYCESVTTIYYKKPQNSNNLLRKSNQTYLGKFYSTFFL